MNCWDFSVEGFHTINVICTHKHTKIHRQRSATDNDQLCIMHSSQLVPHHSFAVHTHRKLEPYSAYTYKSRTITCLHQHYGRPTEETCSFLGQGWDRANVLFLLLQRVSGTVCQRIFAVLLTLTTSSVVWKRSCFDPPSPTLRLHVAVLSVMRSWSFPVSYAIEMTDFIIIIIIIIKRHLKTHYFASP